MMIEEITGKDINKKAWDQFIENSPQASTYALSWYLDIVSPGWKAFVLKEENKTLAVLPFKSKKYAPFLNQIIQPLFTQQLGVFTSPEISEEQAENFLSSVLYQWSKSYFNVYYQFNSGNKNLIPKTIKQPGTKVKSRLTHKLYLSDNFPSLYKGFSTNQKRNIKKALKSGLKVSFENNPSPLIELFKKNKGKELKEVKGYHYKILKHLYYKSQEKIDCELIYIKDVDNNLLAGGFFLINFNYIIYLFGGSVNKGREQGAMPLVFNTIIEKYAGSGKILDFEGSDIPSLARFFKGFGAEPENYYAYTFNKLNFLTKILRKIKDVCFS